MLKRKFVCVLIALSMILTLTLAPSFAQDEQPDFELLTNGPTVGSEVIEISFKNNTQDPVTLTGPVDIKASWQMGNYSVNWERESLNELKGDEVFGEQEEIVVPADGELVIVSLAPGVGTDWRSFDSSDYDLKIELWILVDGIDHHLEADFHEIIPDDNPYDLTFTTNTPQEYIIGEPFNTSLIITATNNGDSDVTLSGPVVINPDEIFQQERELYELIGDDDITIAPGQTVDIVEIIPGPPMSWRNFYFPQVNKFIAFFQISGNQGDFITLYEDGEFCILGEIEDVEFESILTDVMDNEDGTATFTIQVTRQISKWGVRAVLDGCEFYAYDSDIIGPETGITKEWFKFYKLLPGGIQELVGKVLSSSEIEPGVYEVIWSYEDGTHVVFAELADQDEWWGVVDQDPDGWDPYIEVIISTQQRQVKTIFNQETDKHEGTLEYKTAKITFSADEDIEVEINYKRKGETLKQLPEDKASAGIFLDINIARGTLPLSTTILLEIDYSRDDIPVGMNEENLRLYRYNEDTQEWDLLPNQTIDTQNKILSVLLTGFSEFGVFEATEDELATPVDEDETDEDIDEDVDEEDLQDEMGDNTPIIALIIAVIISVLAIAFMFKKSRKVK